MTSTGHLNIEPNGRKIVATCYVQRKCFYLFLCAVRVYLQGKKLSTGTNSSQQSMWLDEEYISMEPKQIRENNWVLQAKTRERERERAHFLNRPVAIVAWSRWQLANL